MSSHDVIVIGAGIIGSWTAYHLAKSGVSTLMIEQFPLPHSRGSSSGQSRLTKRSHRKPYMSDLIPESISLWKTLEKESGTTLLMQTGHLSIAETETVKDVLEPMTAHLRKSNVKYVSYNGSNIGAAFPGLDFNSKFDSFFEPDGQVIKAEKCLPALQRQFLKHGGVIRENEKVVEVKYLTPRLVSVHTVSGKVYYGKSVVLTCGPWVNKVLRPFNIQLDLKPVRVTTYYWKEKTPGKYSISNNFPPFMVYFSDYHIYSIPSYEYPGMMKVCYHFRAPVDPDAPDLPNEENSLGEKERFEILQKSIIAHLPQLEPVPVLTEKALQTVTPTYDFIIDSLPNYRNIIIGAGFSGTGFGPSPAIGHVLSRLATFQDPGRNIDNFAIGTRYSSIKSNL